MSTDYSEIFCTAVDEIVSKRLENLEYDITKTCTIIDDSNKKTGKYRVSSGAAKFDAYAAVGEYSTGETVLVTIPNGDYSSQKIIVGRSVVEADVPANYTSPLGQMTRIKEYIYTATSSASLLANEIKKSSSDGGSVSSNIGFNMNYDKLTGFTKLGVSAKFKAWLLDMDTTSGDYGLKITIEHEGVLAQGLYGSKFDSLYFSAADMIGNPYAFESYYSQEKVFDISHFDKIKDIKVQFYQRGNFKDSNGNLIPYKDLNYNSFIDRFFTEAEYQKVQSLIAEDANIELIMEYLNISKTAALAYVKDAMGEQYNATLDDFEKLFKEGFNEGSILEKNLFVKNIKLHFGYAADAFTEDNTLVLYTPDGLTYHYSKDNDKQIYIRWTRKVKDGLYEIVSKSEIDFENECEIRWFKENIGYTPPEGEELDPYAGANWEPIKESKSAKKNLSCKFTPRAGSETVAGVQNEYIKAIAVMKSTVMNGFKEEESIQTYSSDILTLTNEEKAPDNLTFVGNNTFKIVCRDGSDGSYYLYNQSGKIRNEGKGRSHTRYLQVTYQDVPLSNLKSMNLTANWIKWYIPTNNTMLITTDVSRKDNDGTVKEKTIDGLKYYEITRKMTRDENLVSVLPNAEQGFSIKNQWTESNYNNTIRCKASINGTIYEATKELRFGKSGTSGTNQTFLIECEENKTALTINSKGVAKPNTLTVNAQLYDIDGKEIEFSEAQQERILWSWYKKTAVTEDYILLPEIKTGKSITLTCNTTSIPDDNYYILQAKYTRSDDFAQTLTAYFPVPLKTSKTVKMDGAREVFYDSQGNPSYYNDAYILYQITNGKEVQVDPMDITWSINYDESLAIVDESLSSNNALTSSYLPSLKAVSARGAGYVGLSVSPMYASGYNNKVCVSAYNSGTKIGWSQPILILKTQYDFPMLNDWDGTLTMNEENGTILSTMLGAGRKNSNNTFSGVLIGDITQSGSEETQLGVYGINEGEISYSLKEDGTATFGKKGRGQIHIDGNKGTIESGNYRDDSNNPQGMKIDLDDGIIDIRSSHYDHYEIDYNSLNTDLFLTHKYYTKENGDYVEYTQDDYKTDTEPYPTVYEYRLSRAKVCLSPGYKNEDDDEDTYFVITGNSGEDVIKITDKNYYLQSENWSETKGEEGSKFSLNDGRLDLRSSTGNVILSSSGNPFFEISDQNYKKLFYCGGSGGYYLQSLDFAQPSSKNRYGLSSKNDIGSTEKYKPLIKLLVKSFSISQKDGDKVVYADYLTKYQEVYNYYIGFLDENNKFTPLNFSLRGLTATNSDVYRTQDKFQDVVKNASDLFYQGSLVQKTLTASDFNKHTYYAQVKPELSTVVNLDENEIYYVRINSYDEYTTLYKNSVIREDSYEVFYPLGNQWTTAIDFDTTIQKRSQYLIELESDNHIATSTIPYEISVNEDNGIEYQGNFWSSTSSSRGVRFIVNALDTEKEDDTEVVLYYPESSSSDTIEYESSYYFKFSSDTKTIYVPQKYKVQSVQLQICDKSKTISLVDLFQSTFRIPLKYPNSKESDNYIVPQQWLPNGQREFKYRNDGPLQYSVVALNSAGVNTNVGKGFKFDLAQNQIQSYNLKLSGFSDIYNSQIILDFSDTKYPLRVGDKFKVDWEGNIIIQSGPTGKKYNATKYLLDNIKSSKYEYK